MKPFQNSDKILLNVPEYLREFAGDTFDRFEINTTFRACHFLSQIMHESNDFKCKEENLNYSAQGLLKTFPKYFNQETANIYARNPQKIANRVYANRMGNGDELSNDGWKYRGRGFIQCTGRTNYQALSIFFYDQKLAISSDMFIARPDFLSEDGFAMLSAGWFWKTHGLNEIADKGLTIDVIQAVTKRVNGGLNGLASREDKLNKICDSLQTDPQA